MFSNTISKTTLCSFQSPTAKFMLLVLSDAISGLKVSITAMRCSLVGDRRDGRAEVDDDRARVLDALDDAAQDIEVGRRRTRVSGSRAWIWTMVAPFS